MYAVIASIGLNQWNQIATKHRVITNSVLLSGLSGRSLKRHKKSSPTRGYKQKHITCSIAG
jgi:hypothetical protein